MQTRRPDSPLLGAAHTPAVRLCEELLVFLREPERLTALSPPDSAVVLSSLSENGLLLLCHRRLRELNMAPLTDGAPKGWSEAVARQMAKSQRVWVTVGDALGAMAEAGLRPIVLKGAHASAYYPDRALRAMADLDVLLDGDRAHGAWQILVEKGYEELPGEGRAGKHLPPLADPRTGTPVEIHTALLYPPSDRRSVGAARLAESQVPLEVEGVGVAGLHPEALVVYSLAHQFGQHAYVPAHVIGVCDVAQILEREGETFRWDLAFSLASDSGHEAAVGEGLLAASSLLGMSLPAAVSHWAEGAASRRVPHSPGAGRTADTFRELANVRSPGQFFSELRRGLLPSPRELRLREKVEHGAPSLPLLYAKRICRQLSQLGRLAKERVLGGS